MPEGLFINLKTLLNSRFYVNNYIVLTLWSLTPNLQIRHNARTSLGQLSVTGTKYCD